MRTIVLLADSALSDTSGKTHALGLGWSVTSTPTAPATLVILIEVDWNEANTPGSLEVELQDADGQRVQVPGPLGDDIPLKFRAEYEVGRPAGLPAGTPLTLNFVIPITPGLPLIGGQRYRWKVINSAHPNDDVGVSFFVAASTVGH